MKVAELIEKLKLTAHEKVYSIRYLMMVQFKKQR